MKTQKSEKRRECFFSNEPKSNAFANPAHLKAALWKVHSAKTQSGHAQLRCERALEAANPAFKCLPHRS
jgi:D-tyrosyl-tRNA(Tyr) deacylase